MSVPYVSISLPSRTPYQRLMGLVDDLVGRQVTHDLRDELRRVLHQLDEMDRYTRTVDLTREVVKERVRRALRQVENTLRC